MSKYFVIVPAFNEKKQIKKCINQILKHHSDVIVVDDGSTDKTLEILNKIPNIRILALKQNMGKGNAMRAGAQLAWKLKAKGIIFMDGDNQHSPRHIKQFISTLKKGSNIAIGVRILKTDIPLYRKLGNKVMVFIMKKLFSISVEDMLCGYRAFTKKGYKSIEWESNGYGVETEMLVKIGNKKLSYETIVVNTIYHDKYKGFSIIDGIFILLKLPLWKLKRI